MMTEPSDRYHAAPLEDNMFDWHFTIRGPRDTDFEGGIYHGRIILPSDYPFRPPNIVLLTVRIAADPTRPPVAHCFCFVAQWTFSSKTENLFEYISLSP